MKCINTENALLYLRKFQVYSQPTITCSKLTIGILDQGVKYVRS